MSFRIAVFSLNQWSLDFSGNTRRIIKSIEQAYEDGAMYRVGPELELCGYSLEDAFFESDTGNHCWCCIREILLHTKDMKLVIDIGMPVHFGALYNCRVFLYCGRILCIRAKTSLAKDGIYREYRHFEAWPLAAGVVPFKLPSIVSDSSSQYVPFGANFILEIEHNAIDCASGLKIGWDICQELWDIKNVSADLYHNFGCHLIVNSSGSYWELRKLETINDLIKSITTKSGACYAYSNLLGCDGQRNLFYGRSCIYDNGHLVAMTPTNSQQLFHEIQMISYDINPGDIDVNRALLSIRPDLSKSLGRIWNLNDELNDASKIDTSHRVLHLRIDSSRNQTTTTTTTTTTGQSSAPFSCLSLDMNLKIRFEEEIYHFVSLWLWDYLRRSRMRGFMMPLSGGLDSSTVAVLVYSMCNHLKHMLDHHTVRDYFNQVHQIPSNNIETSLSTPEAICGLVLKCCYISTKYSSDATQRRAENLSKSIGAHFSSISIQDIYQHCKQVAQKPDAICPPAGVSLLEQNLQARLRMLMTYHLSEGNRIVLATGNVDEAIMGYLTKYDCSSADINPIGGLCKEDLKSYLQFAREKLFASNEPLGMVLAEIIDAPPSAELTGSEQRDEEEIGLTYAEISVLGKLRRGLFGCSGPRRAFEVAWRNRHKPPFCTKIRCLQASDVTTQDKGQVAQHLSELIKRFYGRYTRNRHKLTVLTPALHAESYSPDDNRFDHRQFLYPPMSYQFASLDEMVEQIKTTGDIE